MNQISEWYKKPTMSLPEYAKIMGISKSLAFKMAHNGEIPVIRLGQKRLVVPTAAVVRALEQAIGE